MPPPQRPRSCIPSTSSSVYPHVLPTPMVRRGLDNSLPEHLVLTIVVTLTQPTALQPTSDSPVAAMMSRDVLPTATPATPGYDCPMAEVTTVNTNTSSVVVRSLAVIGAVTLGALICVMVAFVFWRYHRLRASVLRRPCKSDGMFLPICTVQQCPRVLLVVQQTRGHGAVVALPHRLPSHPTLTTITPMSPKSPDGRSLRRGCSPTTIGRHRIPPKSPFCLRQSLQE